MTYNVVLVSGVGQSTYIYISIHMYIYTYQFLNYFLIYTTTEYLAQSPVLYIRSLLVMSISKS